MPSSGDPYLYVRRLTAHDVRMPRRVGQRCVRLQHNRRCRIHGDEDCRGDWSAVKASQGNVRDASAIKEAINLVAREFGALIL
jgi:hypothetical protein